MTKTDINQAFEDKIWLKNKYKVAPFLKESILVFVVALNFTGIDTFYYNKVLQL